MRLMALSLILLMALVALMACGPADEADDGKEGDPATTLVPTSTPEPTPTATPKPTETPKPDGEPTKTPEPTKADPPPATEEPTATPESTTTPLPTPDYEALMTMPHPDGIEGCQATNMWVNHSEDMIKHTAWCHQTLSFDVQRNCTASVGTEAQLACARDRLANVQDLDERLLHACSAVTDMDGSMTCTEEAIGRVDEVFTQVWEVWPVILANVESDPAVKARKTAVGDCMEESGHTRPYPDMPITWQTVKPFDQESKPDRSTPTQAKLDALKAWDKALDQCAVDEGLYAVQDAKWNEEMQRIQREDPETAGALKDIGIVEVLERDGVAPFLMQRRWR